MFKNKLELKKTIDESNLTPREKEIVQYRFGLKPEDIEEHTLEQTGEIYGITRERVRQIVAKIIQHSST